MTVLDSPIPRFHLAMPVDGLAAAGRFYGEVLGLEQGRRAETWVDWKLVDGRDVPFPHFVFEA
jgi:extradiol dioxygenase family protein